MKVCKTELTLPQLPHTHLASTHSTNSQLIDWIALSYQEQSPLSHQRPHYTRPHRLTADTQTGGRGQHGRSWQSPLGNVYLSLYIPNRRVSSTDQSATMLNGTDNTPYDDSNAVFLDKSLDGRLSLCVGYQLAKMPVIEQLNQTQEQQNLPKIGVKWVNDVGFYQQNNSQPQFQKLAGILIEPVSVQGKMLGVVVGIGVNISHPPTLTATTQEGLNYQAIGVQDFVAEPLAIHDFYTPIEQAICHAITQFNGFSEPSNVTQFIQDFAKADVLTGKKLQINLPMTDKAPIIGTAHGIDSNGSLQILQDDGTIMPIWTGTIQVL
ncbi:MULTISPECIES: biotin--[acetyl-CoA-carboxylase] ligase [unclassified Moraxella]|uniref:biotin--[acetyl-CoA-carboxylase] ligase n=1 Tax=unclassified Moraxella TaxID=2685852 RepID=UPI003AF96E0B